MENYHSKYLNGNKQKVWQELMSLDLKDVKKNSDNLDLIFQYIVNALVQNIRIIDYFLQDSNYVFTETNQGGVGITQRNTKESPTYDLGVSGEGLIDDLNSEISSYGILPEIFLQVYKSINYINLEGYFPEWRGKGYLKSIPVIDPLVLMPLEMILLLFEINDKSTLIESDQYYLGFSPTPYTKENTSDDGLLGIFLYEREVLDGKLANYGKNLTFLEYLRNCFRWGGFPGLAFVNDIPKDDPNMTLISKISREMIPI